jgi:pyruvate formate lyase activating enzyme
LQHEFLLALAKELAGYHLCIETCGYATAETFSAVVERMDLVIMDIKLADAALHRAYTGVDNEKILKNFRFLRESGKPHLIRTPLVPNITDTEENLKAIAAIIGESPWEKLPYNQMAGAKYDMLNMKFEL